MLVVVVLVLSAATYAYDALRARRVRSAADDSASSSVHELPADAADDCRWLEADAQGFESKSWPNAAQLEVRLEPWGARRRAELTYELKEESTEGRMAVGSVRTSRGACLLRGVPPGRYRLAVRVPAVGHGSVLFETAEGAATVPVHLGLEAFATLAISGCRRVYGGSYVVARADRTHVVEVRGEYLISLDTTWEWSDGVVRVDLEPGAWEAFGLNDAGPMATGRFEVVAGVEVAVAPDPSKALLIEVVGTDPGDLVLVEILGPDDRRRPSCRINEDGRPSPSVWDAHSVRRGDRLVARAESGLQIRRLLSRRSDPLPGSGTVRWSLPAR